MTSHWWSSDYNFCTILRNCLLMRLFSNSSASNLRWRERCPFNGARPARRASSLPSACAPPTQIATVSWGRANAEVPERRKKILTERAGWCEKSQYQTKVRLCDRTFSPFSWVRKWSFLKGWVSVLRARVFLFGHFEKTCYFWRRITCSVCAFPFRSQNGGEAES